MMGDVERNAVVVRKRKWHNWEFGNRAVLGKDQIKGCDDRERDSSGSEVKIDRGSGGRVAGECQQQCQMGGGGAIHSELEG